MGVHWADDGFCIVAEVLGCGYVDGEYFVVCWESAFEEVVDCVSGGLCGEVPVWVILVWVFFVDVE